MIPEILTTISYCAALMITIPGTVFLLGIGISLWVDIVQELGGKH